MMLTDLLTMQGVMNAQTLLGRYRTKHPVFNDDM